MDIQLELKNEQRRPAQIFMTLLALNIFIFIRGILPCTVLLLFWALTVRYPKYAYIFLKTIRRDIIAAKRSIFLFIDLYYIERMKWSAARRFEYVASRNSTRPCLKMEDQTMTFQQVKEFTDKIGGFFKAQGLRRGDCVALLMETRLEYPCMWLGLSKIGVITALINSNQRRDALLHSIMVARPKAIIVSCELRTALQEILDDELSNLPIYQYNDQKKCDCHFIKDAIDLKSALQEQPLINLEANIKACVPKDKLIYVYTSGTTGLPKAAVITNLRFLFMVSSTHHVFNLKSSDIIYNPLPLYHSAGGIVAVGNSLMHGSCTVLRKKFSASNFWTDCIKYECTVAQYIGEICRYLLSTPSKPEDTQHQIRLMYGNGLRPQIWKQFVFRFNIPHIVEFYGATEGNSNLVNFSDRIGAVGFRPVFAERFFPVQIIKCDEETGEILRSKSDGFCMRCKPGETGLVIGKVEPKIAVTAYNGYADKGASEKKLLRDVFRNGDVYFNSGDMMVTDILGYFYFKDRTGDTFRWRGENVSTSEVEAIIANCVGLKECTVYGVTIPHVEGKAGMAAILDPEKVVDMTNLSVIIRASLPSYAKPLFIRLVDEMPRTETYKLKKRALSQDGYDIGKIKDPIYYLNKDGVYRLLEQEQFDQILNGNAGL